MRSVQHQCGPFVKSTLGPIDERRIQPRPFHLFHAQVHHYNKNGGQKKRNKHKERMANIDLKRFLVGCAIESCAPSHQRARIPTQ